MSGKITVRFVLNGEPAEVLTDPFRRLIDLLRGEFKLTAVKEGCGEGECGACSVLLDGRSALSCLIVAGQVEGLSVETVEGLSRKEGFRRLQQAFAEKSAVQCGFCTPGFLSAAHDYLSHGGSGEWGEMRGELDGNICRCTGYVQILEAVRTCGGGGGLAPRGWEGGGR